MRWAVLYLQRIIIKIKTTMRVIIQRVSAASVVVDGNAVAKIGRGLLCLVGISRNDSLDDTKWCANKICNLRLFLSGKVQLLYFQIKKGTNLSHLRLNVFT